MKQVLTWLRKFQQPLVKIMKTLEQRLSAVLTFFLSGREGYLAQISALTAEVARLTELYNSNLQEVETARDAAERAAAELQAAQEELARLRELAATDASQDATLDALLQSAEGLLPAEEPTPEPIVEEPVV